jgi:hypothetical protein
LLYSTMYKDFILDISFSLPSTWTRVCINFILLKLDNMVKLCKPFCVC